MENNNNEVPAVEKGQKYAAKAKSFININKILMTIVLNWYWFVISLVVCLAIADIRLRFQTPTYSVSEKILIKDDKDSNVGSFFGFSSNMPSLENELGILNTHSIAQQTVKDLKLYVEYYSIGRFQDILLYKTQPVSVDMDETHVEKLNRPITMQIERAGGKYHLTGTYYVPKDDNTADGPFNIDVSFTTLPQGIGTKAGIINVTANSINPMSDGQRMKIVMQSPKDACGKFANLLSATQSGSTTIVQLSMVDINAQRAYDYIQQVVHSYNKQAIDDKNEVAMRTEEFINNRLEKLSKELGNTEGQLQNYKQRNGMVELKTNARNAASNADLYEQKYNEASTQVALFDDMVSYINNPNNRYQLLPINIGINSPAVTNLINEYNSLAQRRNLLLQSAAETSPAVIPLTTQLDQIMSTLQRAIAQTRRSMAVERDAIKAQYGRYQGIINETPEQERTLSSIGREQEVKSGLYLMLLQKREENTLTVASTTDKAKIIDGPQFNGQIGPNSKTYFTNGILAGIAIPAVILFVLTLFRYKIEGHDDVVSRTTLPVLADVAMASDVVKNKADIVVHENRNDVMDEIFRSIRTNLQFLLMENQKVILCTSTISGEGKTFISSNLAMSFALLGKKVIIVGLDVRKPRLSSLFGLHDRTHGITNLLTIEHPTWEDVESQIVASGINNNLCLLPSGPIPPNPAELVERKSLDIIFDLLRDNFDFIIVDSAPVGLVTDTLAIARVCDVTIFTMRADFTPKNSVDMVNQLAEENKLPHVSIILNGVDMSKKKYGYYYGYGKYGKYGRYGRYGRYYSRYGREKGHYGYGPYSQKYTNSYYSSKDDKSVKQ